MKVQDLARLDGRAGSNGAWRAETYKDSTGNKRRAIWHYSTKMLEYTAIENSTGPNAWNGSTSDVYCSTGHGSVSDQGGMNRLFAALDMPWYYSRQGGASID